MEEVKAPGPVGEQQLPKRYGEDPTKIDLLLHPHPALKQVAIPLDTESEEERAHAISLGEQLIGVTRQFGALGLAANQLGSSRALFAMRRVKEVPGQKEKYDLRQPPPRYELTEDFTVCINPLIDARSAGLAAWNEGCLSFPGKKFSTKRAKWVTVTYLSLPDFLPVTEFLSGLQAVIFQHEWSHLQGKTVADRAIGLLPAPEAHQ